MNLLDGNGRVMVSFNTSGEGVAPCHIQVPCLGRPPQNSMQLSMWQQNIVGVAHYIVDRFELLGALDDAPD